MQIQFALELRSNEYKGRCLSPLIVVSKKVHKWLLRIIHENSHNYVLNVFHILT